jgi:hypothetical protein
LVGVWNDGKEGGEKDNGKVNKKFEGDDEEGAKICENALGAVLFNLGMLREVCVRLRPVLFFLNFFCCPFLKYLLHWLT